MRPVRSIAALLFASIVGMLAAAAPAWAASAATTLQVSPSSITAGDTVVVSGSVGPAPAGSACATSVLLLSRAFVPTDEFAGVPAVTAAVKPGGAFTATTTIPRSTPAGTYTISGRCGGGNIGVSATLEVRSAPTTTTTPAPAPSASATAPPAPAPSAAAPPAAQPTTAPPTTSTADNWIIPGLVGLAVGALAALGAWLLFRRRHPSGLSGSRRSGDG
jgi:hypothetical protein